MIIRILNEVTFLSVMLQRASFRVHLVPFPTYLLKVCSVLLCLHLKTIILHFTINLQLIYIVYGVNFRLSILFLFCKCLFSFPVPYIKKIVLHK